MQIMTSETTTRGTFESVSFRIVWFFHKLMDKAELKQFLCWVLFRGNDLKTILYRE